MRERLGCGFGFATSAQAKSTKFCGLQSSQQRVADTILHRAQPPSKSGRQARWSDAVRKRLSRQSRSNSIRTSVIISKVDVYWKAGARSNRLPCGSVDEVIESRLESIGASFLCEFLPQGSGVKRLPIHLPGR